MIIGRDSSRGCVLRREEILRDYPDSIVSKYWNSTNDWHDFDALYEVIDSYDNIVTPKGIIQLRLGDRIEETRDRPKPDVSKITEPILDEVRKQDNKIWRIHTGFHNSPKDLTSSFEIIRDVYTSLQEGRNRISLHINDPDHADDDFMQACFCENVIFGGEADSSWIKCILKMRKRLNLVSSNCTIFVK